MPGYMLLLYNQDSDFAGMGPEDMQGVIEKYKAWRDRLQESGRLIGSDKLKDEEGRVITSRSGSVRVLDGPYSETKEVIGGYFAIRAADYEEAVKVCEDCPHVEYGGTVEIREIDEHH